MNYGNNGIPSLVRGGGHGRGRGAGASRVRRRGDAPCALGQLFQSAVLFKIVPGRGTVVMGVDAVVALIGIVYCGQDGYLVRPDSSHIADKYTHASTRLLLLPWRS